MAKKKAKLRKTKQTKTARSECVGSTGKKKRTRKHSYPTPRHPAMKYLKDALGPVKKPSSRREYLVDKMDLMFMFNYQAGMDFEDGVWILEREMKSWRVSPRGPTGRYLFQMYIEHKLDEFYGDFDYFKICHKCGKEFRPKYDMEYLLAVLKRRILCQQCRKISERCCDSL